MGSEKLIETEQFIEELSSSVKHILWKKFPRITQEEKEDIAQEVKLKIWRMLSTGKKISNLTSYLWRVVYSTALDFLNKRVDSITFDEEKYGNFSFHIPLFKKIYSESQIEKKELRLIIEKAMNSLPQNRRIVIKLYLNGMNVEEVANFLDWSKSKVNHLYYRGLDDLKGELKKLGI